MAPESRTPSVMFVCVKNGGKSQMAAALMRRAAADTVEVHSAGTQPGSSINALSAQTLLEIGVNITGEQPKSIDDALLARMDFVVTLGSEAEVPVVDGPRFENWNTDEPSERGIDGIERMRLVRDDIAARLDDLLIRIHATFDPTPEPATPPLTLQRHHP